MTRTAPSGMRSSQRRGTPALWIQAFRPRTLPASIAPVFVGIACAANERLHAQAMGRFWFVSIACILVALMFQIAVNFANDYSDGIRGSDSARGDEEQHSDKPQRLVASGVNPKLVLAAAAISVALASLAGVAAIVATGHYWLLLVGIACVASCWFYTGGAHPYGYAGFGELAVFVFFGLAATLGTQYLLADSVDMFGIIGAINTGLLSSVMLMVNNVRDIDDDIISGKRTLAVRLGRVWALRIVYVILAPALLSVLVFVVISFGTGVFWWVVLGLAILNVACVCIAIQTLRGSNPGRYGKALAFSGFILLTYAAVQVITVLLMR